MPRPKTLPTIRAAVAERAAALGLNAYDLAEKSGVGKDQIWRYLTGRSDIATAKADALLSALGISLVTAAGR